MRLSRLIADFELVQTRLARSMTEESSIRSRVRLMHRAAALMQKIEDHTPEDATEHRAKFDYFLARARRSGGGIGTRRDLSIALDMLNRDGSARPPDPARSCQPLEVVTRLIRRGANRNEVATLVAGSHDRMSLLDTECRHVVSSQGNARFHNRPTHTFAGVHMADLIGVTRYETRARGHLQGCLAGRPANYYYPLTVPDLGERAIQCAIAPIGGRDSAVDGMLLWVKDVTDELARPRQFLAGLG